MTDSVGGLNLVKDDVMKGEYMRRFWSSSADNKCCVPVFKLRGSFQVLTKLVLSDVHLSDDDLTNLNDLTSLHTLFLGNTHIGDIA